MNIWDEENLGAIKELVRSKGLSNGELLSLIQIGRATALNPFLNEIWIQKYGSDAQIFIGINGYRRLANSHPDYSYHQGDAVYENDFYEADQGKIKHTYNLKDRGRIVGAYCIVKRKGGEKPIYVFVTINDYDKKKGTWSSMKHTMIAKVAESQALRKAFENLLGGTYTPDEYEMEVPQESVKLSQTEKLKQALPPVEDPLFVTERQLELLTFLIDKVKLTKERVLKALINYKADSLETLTQSDADEFIEHLENMKGKLNAQ